MRLVMPLLVAIAVIADISPSAAQSQEQREIWNRPTEPFRLIGNVYYVGTAGLSSFLITGPEGHVLIDGGLAESAPLIAANVRSLGFQPTDVRYILINHAHGDHAGGLAALKALTGAQLVASAGDRPDLEAGRTIGRSDIAPFPPVHVDRVIADGETLTVGSIRMTAHLTPGHTRGATSWLTTADGKRVLFASSLTVAGEKLVDNADYPGAAADFRSTFAKLRKVDADVFVNFHTEGFSMPEKRARQEAGTPDAFIDAGELGRQLDSAEKGFAAELAEQQRTGAAVR